MILKMRLFHLLTRSCKVYTDITPSDVRRFEKESNISFFSLLDCSLVNVVTLVSLLMRSGEEQALSFVVSRLENKSLLDIYEDLIDELVDLGFISKRVGVGGNSIPVGQTFHSVWAGVELDALDLGISYNDFWSLKPKLTSGLLARRISERKQKVQGEVDLANYTARLMALAVNAPSKLREPPKLFEDNKSNSESQADIMRTIKSRSAHSGSEDL